MNSIEDRLEQLADVLNDRVDGVWVEVVQSARTEIRRLKKAESLLIQLVDIDWCIGYELTMDQYVKLDNIRTEAAILFENDSKET